MHKSTAEQLLIYVNDPHFITALDCYIAERREEALRMVLGAKSEQDIGKIQGALTELDRMKLMKAEVLAKGKNT